MMEETMKPKRKLYRSELIWYICLGVVWVTGFVLAILGTCAYNVGRLSANPLYQAEKGFAAAFGQPEGTVWDFRIAGSIFMVVAMVLFLVVIFYFSDKITRDEAAEKRKEERRRILMAGENPAAPEPGKVVEAKATPVKEEKQVEEVKAEETKAEEEPSQTAEQPKEETEAVKEEEPQDNQ